MSLPSNLITDNIPVEITVRIGRRRMTVAELSAIQENDIIPLDQAIDEGVEICVGDHVIAKGELVTDDGPDSDRLMLRILSAGSEGR